MITTSVRGRITIMGQPVESGWLEFHPVDGTIGNLRSVRLGRDGRFATDRVPVGKVKIRLVGSHLGATGDPAFDRFLFILSQGPIVPVTIPKDPGPPLEIDLKDAYRAILRSMAPRTATPPK